MYHLPLCHNSGRATRCPPAGCNLRSVTEVRRVAPVLVAVNVEDGAGADFPGAKQQGTAGLVLREVVGFAIVRGFSGSDS